MNKKSLIQTMEQPKHKKSNDPQKIKKQGLGRSQTGMKICRSNEIASYVVNLNLTNLSTKDKERYINREKSHPTTTHDRE